MGIDQVSKHDHSTDTEGGKSINPRFMDGADVGNAGAGDMLLSTGSGWSTLLGGEGGIIIDDTSQTISSASSSYVSFGTVFFDDGSYTDTSNNQVVAQEDGRYLLYANLQFAHPASLGRVTAHLDVVSGTAFSAVSDVPIQSTDSSLDGESFDATVISIQDLDSGTAYKLNAVNATGSGFDLHPSAGGLTRKSTLGLIRLH
jgi:hypothetical protein